MKLHVLILSLVFGVCFSSQAQRQVIRRGGSVGSAPNGTVVNSGTSAVGNVVTYSDVTGTNVIPSLVTVGSLTNLMVPGTLSVTQTNYVNEVNIANGATLGGVRRTSWPTDVLGTPYTLASPVYLAWSNGPAWIASDGVFEDFTSGNQPWNANVHTAGSATSAFISPATATKVGRNGFWRAVMTAPGGSGQYTAQTWLASATYTLWNNYYYSTAVTLETSLTNVLIQSGLTAQTYSTTNFTKGVIWELDQSKSSAFIARTGGASSTWAWTNTTPVALNTWYTLGWYGNTNGVVFLIDSIPVATNTDNSTLPGFSSTLSLQHIVSNSKTNNTGGANNIVYTDTVQFLSYP